MQLLLGVVLFSWLIHSVLFIPFIRLLYHIRLQRLQQVTRDMFNKRTPLFDKFHQHKAGTPVGGGLLVITLTTILLPVILMMMYYFWIPVTSVYPMASEVKILIFTFLSFGLLGLLDDAKKTFAWVKNGFFGLRLRHKLILEIVLAAIIGFWLVHDLKIGIINVPLFGVLQLGWWYIPFAVFVIIAFANAFNITDGLDGLSAGVLVIALLLSGSFRLLFSIPYCLYLSRFGSGVCWHFCTLTFFPRVSFWVMSGRFLLAPRLPWSGLFWAKRLLLLS